jgi:1-acyl-sn-glycerol-3-phosphate acyltransferase
MKKWYFISPLILQKLTCIPTRLAMNFFGHLEVKGLENLKGIKGSVIFACNHASELDPILPPISLPFFSHFSPMFYASREKKFYGGSGWRRHFYGGNFFKAWGSYQVLVGLRNYEKAVANQIRIVNDGGTVCIFPEGRTTPNGMIQPAKGGVAYLAYVTKVPIVPVRLDGTFRLSAKDFFLRKRKLSITFGKPIYITSPNENIVPIKECKESANTIMNTIRNMV